MIKSVTIKDFQSVEDVDLEFHPGFNVLVGQSNSGKSAILRAIRGAIRNEIAPSFVRLGTRKASISLSFGEHTVGADRGKSLSTYRLDEEEFTKCGKDVPQPIIDVLQMNLVNGEDLNFQFQFDSPFLISSSGSTVAQVIGTLTNVTLLFHAIQEANRLYLRASSELTIRLTDIETQKSKIGQFSLLEKRNALTPTLEQKVAQYKEITRVLFGLDTLTSTVVRVRDSIPVKVELPDLEAVFAQYHELEGITRGLSNVTQKIITTERSIKDWNSQLETIHESLETVSTEFCPTCGQKLKGSA